MTKDTKHTDLTYIDQIVRDKIADYKATTNLSWQDVQQKIKLLKGNKISTVNTSIVKTFVASVIISAGFFIYFSFSENQESQAIKQAYTQTIKIDSIRQIRIDSSSIMPEQIVEFKPIKKFQDTSSDKDTLVKIQFVIDTTYEKH